MELKQQTLELKTRLTSSVEKWGNGIVDSMSKNFPSVKPVSKYLKRGLHNYLVSKDGEMTDWIDSIMLFVADENGVYDKEEIFDDIYALFSTIQSQPFHFGIINGKIESGTILFELPEFDFLKNIMGGNNAIRIKEADFKELKAIFTDEL